MASYRLIPYGISDFAQVRREDKYYADKTMYLPKMETAGNFLFFIRPRRFGKSLFITTFWKKTISAVCFRDFG